MTPENEFGLAVRRARELRGWTQSELAERVGLNLHPSAIAKIELQVVDRPRAIRLNEAVAVAKVLHIALPRVKDADDEGPQRLTKYPGDIYQVWLKWGELSAIRAILQSATEVPR